MGGLLHLVQRGGDWAGPVPFTALMYSGPLLCAFNVPDEIYNKIYFKEVKRKKSTLRVKDNCQLSHARPQLGPNFVQNFPK